MWCMHVFVKFVLCVCVCALCTYVCVSSVIIHTTWALNDIIANDCPFKERATELFFPRADQPVWYGVVSCSTSGEAILDLQRARFCGCVSWCACLNVWELGEQAGLLEGGDWSLIKLNQSFLWVDRWDRTNQSCCSFWVTALGLIACWDKSIPLLGQWGWASSLWVSHRLYAGLSVALVTDTFLAV